MVLFVASLSFEVPGPDHPARRRFADPSQQRQRPNIREEDKGRSIAGELWMRWGERQE